MNKILRSWLIGASAGTVIGGLVGVVILPLGWLTVVFAVAAVVGVYILQAVLKENKDE